MAKGQKPPGQKPKTQETSTPEATKPTKHASIYIESFHRLPREDVARFGEPKVIPLDVQERACRAYCERMDYRVFGVYRATTPPPPAQLHARLRIFPEPIKVFYEYDSRHPYHWVRNLLEEDTVDVVVQFREVGPSGPMFPELETALGTSRSHLTHFEYASLWEISPPTEKEHLRYELVERIGEATSEEEIKALAEQVKQLSAEIKREAQEADARATTEREEALAAAQPRHYQVVIDWDEGAQTYLARVPELPGCMAHGTTFEEAAREVQVAIRLWQDVAKATKSNE